jgi:HAT1-interacting factor 1
MQQSAATDASELKVTIESAVEHAKRAFALKKYEQAVEHYATALELM